MTQRIRLAPQTPREKLRENALALSEELVSFYKEGRRSGLDHNVASDYAFLKTSINFPEVLHLGYFQLKKMRRQLKKAAL